MMYGSMELNGTGMFPICVMVACVVIVTWLNCNCQAVAILAVVCTHREASMHAGETCVVSF